MRCDVSWIFMLDMIFIRKQNNFRKKSCLRKNKNYIYLGICCQQLFSPWDLEIFWYSSKFVVRKKNSPFWRGEKSRSNYHFSNQSDVEPAEPKILFGIVWFLLLQFHNSDFQSVNLGILLEDMFQSSIFNFQFLHFLETF